MASCASARLAGVVTVAISPSGSVMAVCAASKDIAEGVVRASLCVEASEKSVSPPIRKETLSSEAPKTRLLLSHTHLRNDATCRPPTPTLARLVISRISATLVTPSRLCPSTSSSRTS